MNITVVGLGKVGRPVYDTLRKYHETVIAYDNDPRQSQKNSIRECIERTDTAIFVVQTPSLPDGSFSNVYLKNALENFHDEQVKQQKLGFLYVVTSTTVPGSCEEFRKIVGDEIVYNPLFIRLPHIHDDLEKPNLFLVGHQDGTALLRWADIWPPTAPIVAMSLTEAELAKITLNCALTVKISLANQLHLVAKRMNCDSKKIMQAVGLDPRIGLEYLTPGWPYGGPCLPRDNRMFQYTARRVGIDAALSRGADEINNRISHETDV